MAHKVYSAIIAAVNAGTLSEPFSMQDFKVACPVLGNRTSAAFLDKHSKGNPVGNSELFDRVSPGRFNCLRPFSYGL